MPNRWWLSFGDGVCDEVRALSREDRRSVFASLRLHAEANNPLATGHAEKVVAGCSHVGEWRIKGGSHRPRIFFRLIVGAITRCKFTYKGELRVTGVTARDNKTYR